MVVVSYGGLPLDDTQIYYIYIADLETANSLTYSGSKWGLAASYDDYYFTFQSTRGGRPQPAFRFKVTHLGNGRFQLSSGAMTVRSAQTTPIDISSSIYNNGKKPDPNAVAGGDCLDDFDCPGTLVCEADKCKVRDMPGGYRVNSGKRYGLVVASAPDAGSNHLFEHQTRPCKWTNCLHSDRCSSDVTLLNPGTEFPGGDGWEYSGIRDTSPEGSYTCVGGSHRLCCPRDSVARANYTFISSNLTTEPPVARFGALAAGFVGDFAAVILKVVDVANASISADVAFCGVTDYRIKPLQTDSIAYTPMLLPIKLPPRPRVFNAYVLDENGNSDGHRGNDERSRETKFRVVFSTQWLG